MAEVFRALDDGTRRVILDELVAGNGQTLFVVGFSTVARADPSTEGRR